MELRKLKMILRRLSKRIDEDAILYFEDSDEEVYYVDNVTEQDNIVYFELDKESYMYVGDIRDKIDEIDSFANIRAKYKDTEFEIDDDWALDDEDDVCMEITPIDNKSDEQMQIDRALEYKDKFKNEYQDEYVFITNISKIAKKMGVKKLLFMALFLYYSIKSGKLNALTMTVVTGALGYLLFPFDAINDLLPVIGYTDDSAVLLYVCASVLNSLNPETIDSVLQKARETAKSIFGEISEDDIKDFLRHGKRFLR